MPEVTEEKWRGIEKQKIAAFGSSYRVYIIPL
jgi:hypothetical protein